MELNSGDLFTNRNGIELALSSLNGNANLKAYYRFTSGALTTDSSGNSRTLTAISDPAETTGRFAGGVDLDVDDAYSIADHADLKPTGNFSIGGWFKKNGASATYPPIFSSWSSNTNFAGIQLRLSISGVSLLVGRNTGTVAGTDFTETVSTLNYCDNKWHFAVGTWDGSNLKVYVDGILVSTTAWANAPGYAATNYVRVGCRNASGTNDRFFEGSLDDVFLFNGLALSQTQISELWGSGLVSYHRFEGNSLDSTDFDNDGTDTAVSYGTSYGKIGQGVHFDGSTGYIRLGTFANLGSLLPLGSFTWSFWIKTTYTAAITAFGLLNTGATTIFKINFNRDKDDIYSAGKTSFAIRDNAGLANGVEMSTNIYDGNWHMCTVVVTPKSHAYQWYVDGSAVTSTPRNTNDIGATSNFEFPLAIGAENNRGTIGAFFPCDLDDMAIFNRALTSGEISTLYNIKAWTKALTDQVTLSEVVARGRTRNFSDIVTLSEAFIKSTSRFLSDAFAGLTDSINFVNGKGLEFNDQISLTDNIQRDVSKTFLETITLSEVLNKIKNQFKEFVDSFTGLIDSLTSSYGRHIELNDTVTTTDEISKSTTRGLLDTMILSESFNKVRGKVKQLTDTLTLSETIVKSRVMARQFLDTIIATDTIRKYVNGILIGTWRKVAKGVADTWTKINKATNLWRKENKPEP